MFLYMLGLIKFIYIGSLYAGWGVFMVLLFSTVMLMKLDKADMHPLDQLDEFDDNLIIYVIKKGRH